WHAAVERRDRREPESLWQLEDAVHRQAMTAIERGIPEIRLDVAIDERAATEAQTVGGGRFELRERVRGPELVVVRQALVVLDGERLVFRVAVRGDDRNGVRRRSSVPEDNRRAVARKEVRRVQVAHELVLGPAVDEVRVDHAAERQLALDAGI